MIAFINDHREAYGIEPICKVLPIAPSIYHDHVAKRLDPSRLSDRAKRDEALKIELRRVFEENFRVYGARKVWRQLRREGFTIARCTVERLMEGSGEKRPKPRGGREFRSTRRVSAAGLAPTSGEIVTQIQLGGSRTDSLVRILHEVAQKAR